ncbi:MULTISPECIES: hypothetical protein [Nocardioides]|uniref:Uncharacterized protein n=1 Tax=Nocardioides vastitatis TaxID=2568655 RepID=A0ABW0ZJM5_9ACTN|nr:hypothetical protein [Nocardioides sp.]THI95376.1 hypothetical protein E7Z54_19320 [Nocardioides sp.]
MTDELDRRLRRYFAREELDAPSAAELVVPGSTAGPRGPHRLSRMLIAAAAVVIVVGGITVLQQRDPDHRPASGPTPPTCPGSSVIRTASLDRPTVPAFRTPLAAARAWAGPDAGEIEIDSAEGFAYLRRDDGTVRAWMRLESTRADLEEDEPSAWSVDGSERCASEASTDEWNGGARLDCPPARAIVGTVVRESRPGQERVGLALEPSAPDLMGFGVAASIGRTPGARSGDVTTTYVREGRVQAAARLALEADRWIPKQLAVCPDLAPGPTPGSDDLRLLPVTVGHCAIDELRHDNRDWTASATDDFGWGGGLAERWVGLGTVTEEGDRLTYRDLGGQEVTFLPTGSAGTARSQPCD